MGPAHARPRRGLTSCADAGSFRLTAFGGHWAVGRNHDAADLRTIAAQCRTLRNLTQCSQAQIERTTRRVAADQIRFNPSKGINPWHFAK